MLNRTREIRAHRASGFTLLELLIATAAMAFVMIYTLGTFTANRNTYVVIEGVSEAHQNNMAIAGLIERDLRTAGYMVLPAAAACGVDNTTGPDMLFVSDADAIDYADDLPIALAGQDIGATLSGSLPTSWNAAGETLNLDDVTVDGTPSYDADPGVAGVDSDFRVNAGAIIADANDPSHGVYCGVVANVDASGNRIDVVLSSPPPSTGTGSWVVVPATVYSISGNALTRNGVVLARDVEDLQVAWFYDLDDDGEVDANEDFGSGGSEPDLDASALSDPGLLREVRFDLVVRTADDDPTDATVGAGQARENRTGAPGPDGRRRRVHQSTIRLRNLASA